MTVSELTPIVAMLAEDPNVTDTEARDVLAWSRDWLADVTTADERDEIGIDTDADILYWANRGIKSRNRYNES